MIASMLALGAVIGGAYPVSAGTNGPPVLTYEKNAIAKDLNRVTTTKERVANLQKELKAEKKAGNNTVALKKELKKAKADRTQAQAYLRADKTDLVMDHQTYVKEKKGVILDDRYALMNTWFSTRSDRKQALADERELLKNDQQALKEARTTRNADILAVNKKISDVNGDNQARLKLEDAGVKMQNLAMK